jgi:hypothetical protein
MARVIEARAVISGTETLSPILEKLSKKMDQLAKNTKTAEQVDRVAASFAKVKTQLEAIEKFNAAKLGFASAETQFAKVQKDVIAAAHAMEKGRGDAKKLEAAYQSAQKAVQAASRAFEQQRTAVLGASRSLSEAGIPLSRVAAEQHRLTTAVNAANAALDRQHRSVGRIRGTMREVGDNVKPFAGPGVLHVTKQAVTAGADIQSKIVEMRAAGISEETIQKQVGASADLTAKYPNVKRADVLERYKEVRSVLLHPDEADTLLDPTIKTNAALNAMDRSGHMSEGLQFAVKAAEVSGRAQDPKRFVAYLDAFVKARQVMGQTITPNTMYDLATNLKSSAGTVSDRFFTTTALSMAQEMRGDRTGVGFDQMIKMAVGGFQGTQHSAAKEFAALGLIKEEDLEKTKTGAIKGLKPGRHVQGWRKAMTDPDKWLYEDILPAMERKGITDQQEQIALVRRLFTSSKAADVVAKLITQRQSFENHAKLYGEAKGTDAILNTYKQDPFVGLNSLATALTNFIGTATSPGMEHAAEAMNALAGALSNFTAGYQKWQKENPVKSEIVGDAAILGAGYLGTKWTLGLAKQLLGIRGKQVVATGAIDAAEAALAGGGAAMTFGSTVWSGSPVAAAILGLNTVKRDSQTPGQPLRTTLRGWFGIPDDNEPAPWMPGGDWDPQKHAAGAPGAAPETRVTGELSGQTEVTVNVKIDPTSEFLKVTADAKKATMAVRGNVSNGPGSLGVSSPDAAAHPVGVGHN